MVTTDEENECSEGLNGDRFMRIGRLKLRMYRIS